MTVIIVKQTPKAMVKRYPQHATQTAQTKIASSLKKWCFGHRKNRTKTG